MIEALAVKTGASYTVWQVVLGTPRLESFTMSASGSEGPAYLRRFLTICDISFHAPVSDIQTGMCGAMTHGEETWRVRVVDLVPLADSLQVRGLALVSSRTEWLDSAPSPEPPSVMPEVERQFYDS